MSKSFHLSCVPFILHVAALLLKCVSISTASKHHDITYVASFKLIDHKTNPHYQCVSSLTVHVVPLCHLPISSLHVNASSPNGWIFPQWVSAHRYIAHYTVSSLCCFFSGWDDSVRRRKLLFIFIWGLTFFDTSMRTKIKKLGVSDLVLRFTPTNTYGSCTGVMECSARKC